MIGLDVDRETFRRYAGLSLPRHVSYPMPTWWHDLSAEEATSMRADGAAADEPRALSLYLHLPFCEALCKFCACNRVILRKELDKAPGMTEAFVQALVDEIALIAREVDATRPVAQIHWGGGTPTYLSCADIERVHGTVAENFQIAEDAEVSVEIDPRVTTQDQLVTMARLGFNRASLGVQDFDHKVQEHVHRIQSFECVRDCVEGCREAGFSSVNFDLIYGMPYQTLDSVMDTVQRTITLSPDRVAYYHYAQIPEKIATQRGIDHTKMPGSEEKLDMFLRGGELFRNAGYEFIGLDHFAKPDELLAEAVREDTITRNFQGMTTGGGYDLIGLGPSAISHISQVGFIQNLREPEEYAQALRDTGSVAHRGKRLTFDDKVRQAVINQLYCFARIQPQAIEKAFGVDFGDYFADAYPKLEILQRDGIVELGPDGSVAITFPLGRVLMRNVAAVFDAYLHEEAYREGEKHCFSTNA